MVKCPECGKHFEIVEPSDTTGARVLNYTSGSVNLMCGDVQ